MDKNKYKVTSTPYLYEVTWCRGLTGTSGAFVLLALKIYIVLL